MKSGRHISEKEVRRFSGTKSFDLGFQHWKLFPDVPRFVDGFVAAFSTG
jgi:hypothetical protein